MKPRGRYGWSVLFASLIMGSCADKPRVDATEDGSVRSEAGVEVTAQKLLAPIEVTLLAAADTYVAQGTPTLNFGAESSIDVTGVALSDWKAGLVAFDGAAIQNAVGTNALQTARLQLTMSSASLGAGNSQIAIHRMTMPWGEQRATWLCANDTDHSLLGRFINNCTTANRWGIEWWSFLPRPFAEPPTATVSLAFGQTGVVTADVTSDVRLALSGTTHQGWLLASTANLASVWVRFSSHEGATPPKLILTILPSCVATGPDTDCDGVDDNCNGQIDEAYASVSTSCGTGGCRRTGSTSCVAGVVRDSCMPGAPAAEDATCNGVDENCNGQTDESYVAMSTSCGVGACALTGSTSCVAGMVRDSCTPATPAQDDATCNGVDDNCNGSVDDGFMAQVTSCGTGSCARTGMTSCVAGTVQNSCLPGTPAPSDATCDGLDDNCNGQVDEAYASHSVTCGLGTCTSTGVTLCVGGIEQSSCAPGTPTTTDATCNALDEDCDGAVDEAYPSASTSCTVGGCLASGTRQCQNGVEVDSCISNPVCVSESDCRDGNDNDGDAQVDCSDSDCALTPQCAPEVCGNELDDDSDGLLDCADLDCTANAVCNDVAPEPSAVAPAANPSIPTSYSKSLEFLHQGADPIQRGVTPGSIVAKRVALISGRILDEQSVPLAGVSVSVLGQPALGTTHTQADGEYVMAVNGGTLLTLSFALPGYLSVQRQVTTDWNRPATIDDVAMVTLSPAVTTVDMSGSTTVQVARGDVVVDTDGTRQGTLLFPSGVHATLTRPDGSIVPEGSVGSLAVRVTEYTAGPLGRARMPAELPATSAYTYAVELSADGAKSVRFNLPLAYYSENFLGFPVGTPIPVGYYDRDRGVWVPSSNGVVIKLLSVSSGLAEVDSDGDQQPDNATKLSALGMTNEERAELAALYPVGKQLWRSPISHFTPWDMNMGIGPTAGAEPPSGSTGQDSGLGTPPPCTSANASTVHCQEQALSEEVDVPGTDLKLHYRSDRVLKATPIRLSLGTPAALATLPYTSITADFQARDAAVQRYSWEPGSVPPIFEWEWDGKDAFGRHATGSIPVNIQLKYHYGCTYQKTTRFGYNGNGTIDITLPPRGSGGAVVGGTGLLANTYASVAAAAPCSISIRQDLYAFANTFDYRKLGVGGWDLTPHHVYDPDRRTLMRGDGEQVHAEQLANVLRTYALVPGVSYSSSNQDPKTQMAIAPDGTIYVISRSASTNINDMTMRLRRINPDGTHTFLGTTCPGFTGTNPTDSSPLFFDNKPLSTLQFCKASDIDVGADGSLYVSYGIGYFHNLHALFRIDPQGIVHTLAGNAGKDTYFTPQPEGALGTSRSLYSPSAVKVAKDGTVLFAQGYYDGGSLQNQAYRFLRLDTEGRVNSIKTGVFNPNHMGSGYEFQIQTNYNSGFQFADLETALGPDGSLYFHNHGCTIYRYTPTGNLERVAGLASGPDNNSPTCRTNIDPIPESAPALTTKLPDITALTVDSAGVLYFATYAGEIYTVTPNEPNLRLFAGSRTAGPCRLEPYNPTPLRSCAMPAENSPVLGTPLPDILALKHGPDRKLYVAFSDRVGVIDAPAAITNGGDYVVPSTDGSELYVFTNAGRHQRTLRARSGATKYSFGYNADGLLTSIQDGDGRTTLVERATTGEPSAIVSPYGQRTELSANGDGFLSEIKPDPSAPAIELSYVNQDGLLSSLRDARGFLHSYSYTGGRLVRDVAPDGQILDLVRTQSSTQTTVALTKSSAGTTTYRTTTEPRKRTTLITLSDGTSTLTEQTPDGVTKSTLAEGTVVSNQLLPDPWLGMLAPNERTTVRLPSGLQQQSTTTTASTLAIASDPLSLTTQTTTNVTNGRTQTSTYTAATKTRVIMSAAGRATRMVLDMQERPTRLELPGRDAIVFAYDAHGRLTQRSQGEGAAMRSTTLSYGTDGFLDTWTRSSPAQSIDYEVDAVGRVLRATNQAGETTEYTFDAASNVTSITPNGRMAHLLAYTPANMLESYTAPAANATSQPATTQWSYTTHREPVTIARPDGQQISIVYDAYGRTSTVTYPDDVITYTYHPTSGQLTKLTASSGAINFVYDGDLLTTTSWTGSAAQVQGSVAQEYEANFWIQKMRVNGADVATFARDSDGLILTAGALGITRSALSGDISATTLSNVTTSEAWNGFGELDNYGAAYSGTELYREQVTQRDGAGRILTRVESNQGVSKAYGYSYDASGRLTDVSVDGMPKSHYEYDGNGNRLRLTNSSVSIEAQYDAQDRLIAYGPRSFSYGAAGELITKQDGNGTSSYAYDAVGQLRRVTLPSGQVVTYEIDALGRRVAKRIDGTKQWGLLYNDALRPAALLAPDNTVTATFVYATRSNVPDYMTRGASNYRFVTDQLGSVRKVVNTTTGNVDQELDYDEFGNVLSDTNPGFQPFGFAGGIYDADTGLVRFGVRDYDAVTGRWTAKDPIGFAGGTTNLYEYVNGDPVNKVDPSGEWDMGAATEAAAKVGGAAGTALGAAVGVCLQFIFPSKAGDSPTLNSCPPCPAPPPGDSRTDTTHPHYPCPGAHTHHYEYEYNQNPYTCQCFLKKVEVRVECH